MSLDIYSPYWMEQAIHDLPVQYSFFKDRYFNSTILFPQEKVVVDYDDGEGNIMAPFVLPRVGDVPLIREGYETYELTPPYISVSLPLSIDDLLKRQIGESIMSDRTPEQREKVYLTNDLATLDKAIARREEWMCVNTMLDNACTMTHIGQNGDKGKDITAQYYEDDDNPGVFTVSEAWDTAEDEYTPGNWFTDVCDQLSDMRAAGREATDLIVGPNVADLILTDKWAWKHMDIRRDNLGEIDPRWGVAGITRIGRLNFRGHDLEIFCYEGTYQERDVETGTLTTVPYFPEDAVLLCAPGTGIFRYGAVTQMEDDKQFHTRAAARVPKYVANTEHNQRKTILTSRPLAAPRLKGQWRACRDVFTASSEEEEETAEE